MQKKENNKAKQQQIENAINKYVDEFTNLTEIQHIFNLRWMQQANNKTTIKSSSKSSSSTRSSTRSSKGSSKGSSKRRNSFSLLRGLKEVEV